MTSNGDSGSRRPLKSRSTTWAKSLSGLLCRIGVTPNAISAASVVFAILGGSAFVFTGHDTGLPNWIFWLTAAGGIQLRLLCNLMDGMVAVEGGKKSATGELWNELPDRFADAILLSAAGVAAGLPWLGAITAMGALLTAYIRALGAALTDVQDFCGPMAKPHRMAVLTVAALVSMIIPQAGNIPLVVALWLIAAGLVVTGWRRLTGLSARMKLQ